MTRKFITALAGNLAQKQPNRILFPARWMQWADDVNAVVLAIPASYARALFLELVVQESTKPDKVAQ